MLTKKKIAFITPSYFPHSGGYSTYTYNACKALTKLGHEITIYSPFNPVIKNSLENTGLLLPPEKNWVKEQCLPTDKKLHIKKRLSLLPGVKIIFYPALMLYSTFFDQRLSRELRLHKYDIINTLGFPDRIIPLGFDKYAQKIHTFCTQPTESRNIFERFYLKKLFSSIKTITAVSAALANDISHCFGISVNKVIYPGVDTKVFKPIKTIDKRDYLAIGMVSQLYWQQKVEGVKLLFRALSMFKQNSKLSFKLFLAGEGPLLPQLIQTIKQLNIEENVFLLGKVQYADMPAFFNNIDLYTHISFQEGLSLAVLEAMACGKPVISSKVGGLPEIVNDKIGWLVDDDPHSILKALWDSFNIAVIRKKGAMARNKIERNFSLDCFAQNFESLIAKI